MGKGRVGKWHKMSEVVEVDEERRARGPRRGALYTRIREGKEKRATGRRARG